MIDAQLADLAANAFDFAKQASLYTDDPRGNPVANSDKQESGSPGLIRTGGRPINSRMLYR